MSSRRLLLLVLAASLGTLASTTPALAQEEDPEPEVSTQADPEPEVSTPAPSPWDRFLAVSATVGLDTPLGIGGAAVEVTPFPYLAIYAGGGVGRDGGRFAGGIRPQAPMGNAALGLMIGLTGGPLDWDSRGRIQFEGDEEVVHRYWELALFFHTGLTFEYRWDEGFFGRLAFGMEALIEPGTATVCTFGGEACESAGYSDSYQPIRGWAGLTVGYAFQL